MATIPKQTISIKDLPTKSVTLYPSRGHVVRDINDVLLKPGLNEVDIWGLTPTADEHSIQIDGKGSATITDMTVNLVPNPERFEDAYPEDSDESDSDSDSDSADSDDDIDAVKTLKAELKSLVTERTTAEEVKASVARRQEILDQYSNSAEARETKPEDMAQLLTIYRDKRAEAHEQHTKAVADVEKLDKKIYKTTVAISNATKEERKRREKAEKLKAKERAKKDQQRQKKQEEAHRTKEERLRFWPKMVYRVTVTLETAVDTPGSSRRNSVDSVTLAGNAPVVTATGKSSDLDDKVSTISGAETLVSLSLSYITTSASWSPCYDINLSSVTQSGSIVYRAELKNLTSETWRDAKISLSTSLTSYSGLDDAVPFMHAWHVRIGKGYNSEAHGLLSNEEANKSSAPIRQKIAQNAHMKRNQLFAGNDGLWVQQYSQMQQIGREPRKSKKEISLPKPQSTFAYSSRSVSRTELPVSSSFASAPLRRSGALGSAAPGAPPPPPMRDAAAPSFGVGYGGAVSEEESEGHAYEEQPALDIDFEESTWEDNGLTTSYDVPGMRTIAPSSTARRHKIATLHIARAHMSHIAVPKLRAAAFLRAKIHNPSSTITLLKGQAGVTLDGGFLGTMSLPRVSPSQVFTLPLGVDPAIQVNYSKPSVHRSTTGVFAKESAQSYTRSIWLTNTRPVPAEILVLDQVPVSEDERLRVETIVPRGLKSVGDKVRAGDAAKEGQKAWGKAVATLKKDGEIAWEVNLEKGGAVVLKLDYEARLPSGDGILTV